MSYVQKRTGLGEHRARRLRNQLIEDGYLVETGHTYRGRHGYRVKLYRVVVASLPRCSCSVRGPRRVKPGEWWRHPLFGNPDGAKPPATSAEVLDRWRDAWRFAT